MQVPGPTTRPGPNVYVHLLCSYLTFANAPDRSHVVAPARSTWSCLFLHPCHHLVFFLGTCSFSTHPPINAIFCSGLVPSHYLPNGWLSRTVVFFSLLPVALHDPHEIRFPSTAYTANHQSSFAAYFEPDLDNHCETPAREVNK